jgi:hypothetical protein
MSGHEKRTDHWRWFIVESSLKIEREHGYDSAFEFMLRYKVDREIAKRVLDTPELRRIPVVWPAAKPEKVKM